MGSPIPLHSTDSTQETGAGLESNKQVLVMAIHDMQRNALIVLRPSCCWQTFAAVIRFAVHVSVPAKKFLSVNTLNFISCTDVQISFTFTVAQVHFSNLNDFLCPSATTRIPTWYPAQMTERKHMVAASADNSNRDWGSSSGRWSAWVEVAVVECEKILSSECWRR